MLSTMKPILGVAKEHSNQKPAVYKFYNFTKGGTDVVNQRIGFYSSKAKSRSWTISTFAYMLDTCRVNSCTVYAINNSKDPRAQDSFNFGMDLAMSLVLPFIQMRPQVGLSTAIQQKMKNALGESEGTSSPLDLSSSVALYPSQGEVRKRCEHCKKEISGPGAKQAKDKLSKILSQCQSCGKDVCQRHSVRCCLDCRK